MRCAGLGMRLYLHSSSAIYSTCNQWMVNSHVAVQVETAMLLHAHLWMQFHPVHKNESIDRTIMQVLSINTVSSLHFSIPLSELLCNPVPHQVQCVVSDG